MAKDYDYDYRYSDSKGPYGVRRKGGRIFIVRPNGSIENATMVGGKIIPRNKDRSLAEDMLDSGRFNDKLRQTHRNQKARDEKEEQELMKDWKNSVDEYGDDRTKWNTLNEKQEDNLEKYFDYNNTKAESERKKYDDENEKFEKSLEKYDDESNKDFLRRGKLKDDFDSGKIGEREYNRRRDELDRRKMERDRKEAGPLREKERERELRGELRSEIEKAIKKNDEQLAKNYNWSKISKKDKVDDYLNRDKSKDKLNYNENTKEDTLYGGTFSEASKRVKENKIVDSFGNNVVYQKDGNNYITSRQNYNDYANGKTDKLGGELVLNEKEARDRLASYDADEKYPYKGYVADKQSGNDEKAKKLKQENLDKMYKTIGYDDSKYNYGLENKSTNETMNNAIREKASNKYEGTKRWGFGYANDDNVPVYNNKIDYTGDFTHANLQTLSDSELKEALNKQTELLNKANAEKVGDRRTRNGRMQAIFNKSEKLQYNNGVNRIKEELVRRENEKYPQYKGTPYEVKYYSLEDVMKDKDSPLNQYIRNKADEKKALTNAWNKYKEEHPNTEMTKSQFKKDIYKKK